MKKILLAFFIVCSLCNGFGQNKKNQEVDIINHEVQFGESVRLISKKYLVDPAEIYKLNKFAVDGMTQGMVLKVPIPRKDGIPSKIIAETQSPKQPEADTQTETKTEVVQEIKTEPVAVEPVAKEPVVTKTVAETPPVTPTNDIKKIVITERKTEVNHKVVAKETLYSLARDFNVAVDAIKEANPEVAKKGLQIGQTIIIPKEKSVDIQQSTSVGEPASKPITAKTETAKTVKPKPVAPVAETSEGNVIKHKVEPKETLYSLSKKYNVTIDEIKQQNEALLKNGLQIGQVLTIKTNN